MQTLDGSANVLSGGAPPDLLALDRVRLAHRQALDLWAADALRHGTPPEDVLAGLDADHWLRVVAYLALAIGSNAVIAAGGRVADQLRLPAGAPRQGWTRLPIRIARTIRTHLVPTSSVLHQSLRVGVGLALAVFLARELALSHGFWVVLGTLSVLRSNALATGQTTIEALIGTAVGFGVGALFMVAVSATSVVLWVALPIAVFLATYAASAIGFIVGQAAFTILVMILFNLLSPVGWRVGLVRIEDVALGIGISFVVGLLLWPRGARSELVTSVADLYRAAAVFLSSCLNRILDADAAEDPGRVRRVAEQARNRAGEAFDIFLNERGAKQLDPQTAAILVDAGTQTILAGDLLTVVVDMGYRSQDSFGAVTTLRTQTQVLVARFLELADRLQGTTSGLLSGAGVSDDALHDAALSALRHGQSDPGSTRTAMAVVIAGEWIQHLGELTASLETPVSKAVEAAHVPWWR